MNWLRKFAPKNRGVVGLELHSDGLCLATRNEQGKVEKLAIFNKQLQEDQSEEGFIQEFVESNSLESAPCHLVLPVSHYQLLLVEAPDVPDEELREAIRWRIKDLISIPLDKAALDIFLLPDKAARGKRMIYVVVAEIEYLKTCIELVNSADMQLKSIDIAELAIRNVSLFKEEAKAGSRGIGMVRIGSGTGNVSLYQEGNLYLSRSFQIDYKGGLLDELPGDSLMLEVQRSLDYYERQMGQRLPAALYIFGENISDDKLSEDLRRGVSAPFKLFELDGDFESEDLAEELIPPCMAAIGACLRGEVQP